MLPRLAYTLVMVALGTACASGRQTATGPQCVAPLALATTSPQPLPTRASGDYDWGLALSGGGIRSGTFDIGVMKALYDAGYMDSVDVISSVSGGGYASYWLYRQYLESADSVPRFGQVVFSDAKFDKSVCELQSVGNFQTFGSMITGAVFGTSFPRYQFAIRRSFGFDDRTSDPEPSLDSIMGHVRRGSAPFFILNATIDTIGRTRLANAIEISPAFFGSPFVGYHEWNGSDEPPGWSESVASAAAAVSALKHMVPNYVTPDADDRLRLWDGGKSENLAALSLIRRRIRNLIIVDGEHDPDYNFEGYAYLRELLPAEGFQLAVPAIDRFLVDRAETLTRFDDILGVSVGRVTSARADGGVDTTRVFYIKLARPASVTAQLSDTSAAYRQGEVYQERIEKLVAAHAPGQLPWYKCAGLAGHSDGFRRETVIHNVTNYARLIDGVAPGNSRLQGPRFLRYDFPQMTTADQSYFTDQLAAMVGIGYLQGSNLKAVAQLRSP
jgi:hypothetical protein